MANVTALHTFDPGTVISIIQAYDDAWFSLRGSIFAAASRAQETRDILAQQIIDIAKGGEHDPARLRDGALQYFGMAA
jgi:hypothetical protein